MLLDAASKLEGQVASPILPVVVEVVEAVKNETVKVDWIDKVIGEILKTRDH